MTRIEKAVDEIRTLGIWDIEQQMHIGILQKIISPIEAEFKDLALWRRKNQKAFRDDHPITIKSTKEWWHNYMTDSKQRVLFWVIDNKKKRIGHIGFKLISPTICELDNIIRGEKGPSGMMYFAVDNLISWIFETLKIKNLYVKTRFDNQRAIKFYESLDFKKIQDGDPLITMKYEGLWGRI